MKAGAARRAFGPSDALNADTATTPRRRWLDVVLLACLVLATLLAYYPAWNGAALWDDDAHLTRLELRSGQGLWRIWFEPGATQQYYPLAHSLFWLQARLWGDQVLGYHLVNIGLHALSAFLVVIILRRLALPGAVLAGVVFALHPVQVESVAWMTELKNTLSGALYLGAALAYLGFRSVQAAVALRAGYGVVRPRAAQQDGDGHAACRAAGDLLVAARHALVAP